MSRFPDVARSRGTSTPGRPARLIWRSQAAPSCRLIRNPAHSRAAHRLAAVGLRLACRSAPQRRTELSRKGPPLGGMRIHLCRSWIEAISERLPSLAIPSPTLVPLSEQKQTPEIGPDRPHRKFRLTWWVIQKEENLEGNGYLIRLTPAKSNAKVPP